MEWRCKTFTKTVAAMALAVFLGSTAVAVAQGWQGSNSIYEYRYGLSYTSSDRHNPTDTNGN